MRLSDLLVVLDEAQLNGDPATEVVSITHDSRRVREGSLFCAVRGGLVDGHAFVDEAIALGATTVLVDHDLMRDDVAQVIVGDVRRAMGPLAARLDGDPSRSMQVFGVTGTNGKTTTTFLLRNILEEAGVATEVLGTLSGPRTTPEGPDLQDQLAQWRDAGVEAVAMEVSSHALDLHRVDGTRFAVAIFTNLSRDHLDHHQTVEAYFDAKARLFSPELSERAVVNIDSPHGRLLRDAAQIPTTAFALDDLVDLDVGTATSSFRWRGEPVTLHIGGLFNVSNALAAAEAAHAVGLAPDVIARGLSRPVVVPGRFEHIDAGQPFSVIVDYAHTPDGLEQLLSTIRTILAGSRDRDGSPQIHTVFGCGGDRDTTKRPAMGEVAARLADRVVLTADNSRNEDTGAIIEAVKEGFDRASPRRARSLVIEPDRRRAITTALGAASVGDVVVVAGKGHETTLTIGRSVTDFDDRVVARDALAALGFGSTGTPGSGTSGPGGHGPGQHGPGQHGPGEEGVDSA